MTVKMTEQQRWQEYEARKRAYRQWQKETGNYCHKAYNRYINKILNELKL